MVIVWGFYTGLAGQLVQKIIPPVEIAQIEKPKDVDKPPPPPPKLEEIKPYVPPPEFVDIQAAPPENNAISVVTQQKTPPPAPVVAAPVQHTITPPRMDPRHPFNIGEEYYPDASKRAGEEGRCILLMRCRRERANSSMRTIQTSTGFPRLDEACLKGVKGRRCFPAWKTASRSKDHFPFAIIWKLTGK